MTKKISPRTLDSLEAFKDYIQSTLKPECRNRYNITAQSNYIYPLLDELLENLEAHIETVTEESIHEEELNYGLMQGE